jgi:polyisoprenoid-binding protein YceI
MSDTPTTTLVRTVDGLELPTPATFSVDPVHSHVGFSVRHMMIAKVRGRFTQFTGTLEVAEDPLQSQLSVDVELASVDTRDEDRDGHLRSADFFDVENHPTMSFRSTGLERASDGQFRVNGDLTVHGVTRPLTLDVSFDGVGQDPWGNQRLGFSASGELNREDFGLTWNQVLDTGGVMLGKQVRLEIETEFVRQ